MNKPDDAYGSMVAVGYGMVALMFLAIGLFLGWILWGVLG